MPSISRAAGTRASRERPTPCAFGQVPDEVGRVVEHPPQELAAVAEEDHVVPLAAEDLGDGLDGLGLVELLEPVVGAVAAHVRRA